MSLTIGILVIAVLIFSTIKSISYAVWNWKHDNKTGSIFVILVCLASLALPAFVVFYKS